MAWNVMNEYINLTKEHMHQYMKLIFENQFDNAIFEEFYKTYLQVRYYDLNGFKNGNTLKTDILDVLEEKKSSLLKKEKRDKRKIILDMYAVFNHLIYFDRVSPNKDLGKTAEDIAELRQELLAKKDTKTFKEELSKVLKANTKQIDDLLEKYDSTDFYVSISNSKTLDSVHMVTLKYNIKMPTVYSNLAITKAFTTGTIGEDKLFIEYSLISIQIIRDIIRGNFKKQYIVGVTESLFEKRQKLERVFKTVNNQAIQEKLTFKIHHELFIKNRDLIYKLMSEGYRFAVIIDETFEGTLAEIERIKIFKYVIVNEEAKWYHNIVDKMDEKSIIKI